MSKQSLGVKYCPTCGQPIGSAGSRTKLASFYKYFQCTPDTCKYYQRQSQIEAAEAAAAGKSATDHAGQPANLPLMKSAERIGSKTHQGKKVEEKKSGVLAKVGSRVGEMKSQIMPQETVIDTTKKPVVWVLGGPGSGKGTQCEKIIAKYGFTHLSTGDLLREEVKAGTERSKCLTAAMERGELVPNEVVLELLKEAIVALAPESRGFLVDGYPREKSQGQAFEQTIAPVTVILYFEASSETLTKRLLGRAATSGRADDNEETIKLRLNTFLANNEEVLAQYAYKLIRIDAERSVDEVFKDVQNVLDPIVKAADENMALVSDA